LKPRSLKIIKCCLLLLATTLLVLGACTPADPEPTQVASTPSPTPTATATTPVATPPPPPPNTPPVIHYINAPEELQVTATTVILCVATDVDSDNLTYAWSADIGIITGNTDNVVWTSPANPGTAKISVIVDDGRGGQAKNSVTVVVKAKVILPPKFLSFTVVRSDKAEFTVTPSETTQVLLQKATVATIKCAAEDPNGEPLTFLWAAPVQGQIIGEGATVQYLSPTQPGDYYVTVTAVNKSGAKARAAIQFHVPCCGLGAFGQKGQ
jgi:hypothetical protein